MSNNVETEERSERQGPGGVRRFYAQPRVCQFCTDHNLVVDYKQSEMLRRFVTDEGKIRPRRQTGTCARHQRQLARAIKRARHLGLLHFTGEALR